MSAGFLYVLTNPSMPGMAKVGKTTRDPMGRVSELSSATGVATPFVLMYQQPVADCHSAEAWVHGELERQGGRVAPNREFFNAPLHEIVALLAKAATLQFAGAEQRLQGELQRATVAGSAVLVDELLAEGDAYENGNGEVIKNPRKAIERYTQAGNLGSSIGWMYAAMIFHHGADGVQPNYENAVIRYRKAVELGAWYCMAPIARVFSKVGQRQGAATSWNEFWTLANQDPSRLKQACDLGEGYFVDLAFGLIDHRVEDKLIAPFAMGIARACMATVRHLNSPNYGTSETDGVMISMYEKAIGLVKALLSRCGADTSSI